MSLLSYEAILSDIKAVSEHPELWKWAGKKVLILPETLTEIPQYGGKKRVDFVPLSAPVGETEKPLSIITDFLTPLTSACKCILKT